MGDIIDLKVISTTENSNKIQKNQVLEEKKSVEDVVTLGPTAQANTRVLLFDVKMARPECDTPELT